MEQTDFVPRKMDGQDSDPNVRSVSHSKGQSQKEIPQDSASENGQRQNDLQQIVSEADQTESVQDNRSSQSSKSNSASHIILNNILDHYRDCDPQSGYLQYRRQSNPHVDNRTCPSQGSKNYMCSLSRTILHNLLGNNYRAPDAQNAQASQISRLEAPRLQLPVLATGITVNGMNHVNWRSWPPLASVEAKQTQPTQIPNRAVSKRTKLPSGDRKI